MMTTTSAIRNTESADGRAELAHQFRQALGSFPTGVALVTARTPAGPVGMTVNSFASVSLDPMLVMFCPAKTSRTWAALRKSSTAAISILSENQESISRAFAKRSEDRFAGFEWVPTSTGHPTPSGAVAWFEVRIAHMDSANAGDHDLVICEVMEWGQTQVRGRSLVFQGGRYGVPSLAE